MTVLTKKNKNSGGFTLIELLIVISVIGVLAGVLTQVVNPKRQKAVAEDGVKRSKLESVAQALESYYVAEDSIPKRGSSANGSPLDTNVNPVITIYLKDWPGTDYYYVRTDSDFAVYVALSTNTARYLKYSSTWSKIQECGATNINEVATCSF